MARFGFTKPKNTGAEDAKQFEIDSRKNLGLPPLTESELAAYDRLPSGSSFSDLIAGLGEAPPDPSKRGQFGGSLFGKPPSLQQTIADTNEKAREDADLQGGTGFPTPKPFTHAPLRQQRDDIIQSNRNQLAGSKPGLGTLLADVGGDVRDVPTTKSRDTNTGFEFVTGGQKKVDKIDDGLQRITDFLGTDAESLAERGRPRNKIGSDIQGLLANREKHQRNEDVRNIIVARRHAQAKSIQQLNQAVFTGRRKRGGSGVQLPHALLAGLSTNREKLL